MDQILTQEELDALKPAPRKPVILAIDPGTKCGWAILLPSGHMLSGFWNLKCKSDEGAGMRIIRLRRYLNELRGAQRIDQVYYERVRRHLGADAAHIYGGITMELMAWCEEQTPKIPYGTIEVSAAKIAAIGKGNAGKEAMIKAARLRWPNDTLDDDNECDARWIAIAAANL